MLKKQAMASAALNGQILAQKIKQELAVRVRELNRRTRRSPGLAYLLADTDPVSRHYVRGKTKACEEVGIFSFVETFPPDVSQTDLLNRIDALNAREDIHGILVQLPLPSHLDTARVMGRVHPSKDVDGFHPYNRGLLFESSPLFAPCTPKGIIVLLKENGITLEGKRVVILGRSLVVGRPLVMLLLNENATVTICHQKTRDLERITREGEIVVVAVGRPRFLKARHVSPGAVVVDVGIHQVGDGLQGDVDAAEVSQVASHLTPVPGGVGPMTVAMLLENTVQAFEATLENSKLRERIGNV